MNQVDRILRILFRELSLKTHLSDCKALHTQPLSFGNEAFCNDICKQYLSIYPNNYSFDEVSSILTRVQQEIMDAHALHCPKEASPLYLFSIYANRLFTLQNNHLLLKFEHLLEWDGFTNKVDPVVFQAAFLSQSYSGTKAHLAITCSPIIRHTEKRLYKLLSQGAYETHMHLNGSGYSWEINWHNLACCTPLTYHKKCCKNFLPHLDCIAVFQLQALRTYLLSIAMPHTAKPIISAKKISTILASTTADDYYLYQDQLHLIHHQFDLFAPDVSAHPQAIFLRERFFLTLLFTRLHCGELSLFEQNLMMIYISLMCNMRFYFVQDNIGMGFDKFKRSEQLKECFFQKGDDEKLLESVLDRYYNEGFVEGVELRIAPKSKKEFIRKVHQIERTHQKIYQKHLAKDPSIARMKLGIIVHYIKSKDEPLKDEPFIEECRHTKLRKHLQKQANELTQYFEAIKAENPAIPTLAVDAANAEIYCSPEVFAPIFRQHRASISLYQPLGFTYHVGEDFLNLSSGLRAIDDVLTFFNFIRGDRLGHAIALGTNVSAYLAAKRRYVIGTQQSMVDDYAWLYDIIATQSHVVTSDLLTRLEHAYQQHARTLFQGVSLPIPSITTYRQGYLLRGDDPALFRERYERGTLLNEHSAKFNTQSKAHQTAIACEEAQTLYHFYHYDKVYRINSQKAAQACADETYQEAVTLAQKILRQKIYAHDISIETNPTSNKRISYISTYDSLPLLRFNTYKLNTPIAPYTPRPSEEQHLQVSINTDDSAIFQTDLSSEYSFVAAALLRAGYEKEETFDYIDHIRMLSKATTFLTDIDTTY